MKKRLTNSNNDRLVPIDLSRVDTDKLPPSLGSLIHDLQKCDVGHTNHSYYSDEPRYDHTRED